jgi:acyl-CoA synthetase (AMP-forming)/AMP-acid ligase II
MKTIPELFRDRLQSQPEKIIYQWWQNGAITDKLSFASLDGRARAAASRLLTTAAPGDRVLIILPPGLDPIVSFYACLFTGMVAVPIPIPPPGAEADRVAFLKRYLEDAQSRTILTTRTVAEQLKPVADKAGLEDVRWVLIDEISLAEGDGFNAPPPPPESPALMLYTSGSTQLPRGILATHANLAHGILANSFQYKDLHDCVTVLWVPLYFAAGLITTQHVLTYDTTQVLMATQAFIQKPVTWLRLMSEYHAGLTAALSFSYRLCADAIKPEDREGLDLSSWKVAIIGGEPVQLEVMERFARAYQPYGFSIKAFQPLYMMSETTGAGALADIQRGPKTTWIDKQALEQRQMVETAEGAAEGRPFTSCGRVSPGHQLVIVDPENLEICPPGKIGEIWLSGPAIARGYWNKPEATAATYGAHLAGGEGPFLRSGDLGFLKDGEVYIVGRIKEILIIHGRNISAIDIEAATAGAHPALIPGAVAAFGITLDGEEKAVIMHEVKPGEEDLVQEISLQIRQAVSKKIGIPLHAIMLLKPGSLPRSGSGKILRFRCRNLFWELSPNQVDKKRE